MGATIIFFNHSISIYILSFQYICDLMRIPNKPKGRLVSFLITIQWFEGNEKKHVVLHVREHKRGHYHARISHLTSDKNGEK